MRALAGVEISFDRIIEDKKVIEAFSDFVSIPASKIWNSNSQEEAEDPFEISMSYSVSADEKELLCSFLFNTFFQVEGLFELDLGIYFSEKFECATMVSDPSNNLFFIRRLTTGELVRCHEERDDYGRSYFKPVQVLTYDDIRLSYEKRNL